MATEKQYKKFLKERGYARAFREYQKAGRKTTIEYSRSQFDRGGKRFKAYVIKAKHGYVIKDFFTLQTLGRSKRKLSEIVSLIRSGKQKESEVGIKGKLKQRIINILPDYSDTWYSPSSKQFTNVVNTKKAKYKKFGHVVVDVMILKDNTWHRSKARSSAGDLSIRKVREQLLQEAVNNAAFRLGFTPDAFIINEYWFEYWSKFE